jgi:hypothetical protein
VRDKLPEKDNVGNALLTRANARDRKIAGGDKAARLLVPFVVTQLCNVDHGAHFERRRGGRR